MDKNTLIKVANRGVHSVGYKVPELSVNRQFSKRETKEIPFNELQQLFYLPGGERMLTEYLIIKDKDAIKELGLEVEPEYFYSEKEIKKLLTEGSLDEFLDCLDFAPDGVLDIIKDLAVSLPLNDMSKIHAIQEKMGFNVSKAIEIRKMKYDGGDEDDSQKDETPTRRVVKSSDSGEKIRRVSASEYKVVNKLNK